MWDIIKPKDNYAGCRKFMAENAPCLPFLFPCVAELRQSKNASNKIMELFQFLAYFGSGGQEVVQDVGKQVVREGASESWYRILFGRVFHITFVSVANRNSPNYPPSSSPTRRPKRKAVQDLNLKDSQRNNLNKKRRKVDNNASYNYIL